MPIFYSPAKINLFLKVQKKRSDGYHELASLFQTIDFCDELHIELAKRDSITSTDPTLPLDQRNLVVKALKLFRQKTGLEFQVKIHIHKRIPVEAGFAGGSSNAATTLWALNKLLDQGFTDQKLGEWGAEIGSDISFFLSQGTAFCTGRGEIVEKLPPLPSKPLWIAKPSYGLSTPAIFKNLDANALKIVDPKLLLEQFLSGKISAFNDLEQPAFKVQPNLQSFKINLQNAGFEEVVMTGSGSAFFCIGGPRTSLSLPFALPTSFLNRTQNWYQPN